MQWYAFVKQLLCVVWCGASAPAVWEARFGRPSLTSLYQSAMEAIYKVQPDAIFVLEVRRSVLAGWGQKHAVSVFGGWGQPE
jgi:hypothetical protein